MFSFFRKTGKEAKRTEFSVNLDSEDVRPFLDRVFKLVDCGFHVDNVELLCRSLASLELDQEFTMEIPVRYDGYETKLRVNMFLDDTDSPDLYIWAVPDLTKRIEAEYLAFSQEDQGT